MLLIAPILSAFEFVQVMAIYGTKDFNEFVWAYMWRILCIALQRIFLDPTIHNIQIYKKRLLKWLLKKSEDDDFYDKFLKFFDSDDKSDKIYYFHTDKNLESDDEVPVESI